MGSEFGGGTKPVSAATKFADTYADEATSKIIGSIDKSIDSESPPITKINSDQTTSHQRTNDLSPSHMVVNLDISSAKLKKHNTMSNDPTIAKSAENDEASDSEDSVFAEIDYAVPKSHFDTVEEASKKNTDPNTENNAFDVEEDDGNKSKRQKSARRLHGLRSK